jgi:transposase
MPLLRYLQHWLTGQGPCLQVADFVPETHPIRQWADTFPWAALVAALERSFTQRFPKPTTRGRPPVSTRVLLALELLKHELACSDAQICSRLRTDLAVMYACGLREVQVDGSKEHFVLPEVLAHFRSRLDAPLMEELLALQAASAMEDGLVSPAHVVVDTFPSEQGSQRVNDAATLYKAQKNSSRSSRPSPSNPPPEAPRSKGKSNNSSTTSGR